MLTFWKIYKLSADANFNLCSQITFFAKVLSLFLKMDIYKCPKSLFILDFSDKKINKIHNLEYILPKWLKEPYIIYCQSNLKSLILYIAKVA